MKFIIRDGDKDKTILAVNRFANFLANLQYYLLKQLEGDELTVTISNGYRRTEEMTTLKNIEAIITTIPFDIYKERKELHEKSWGWVSNPLTHRRYGGLDDIVTIFGFNPYYVVDSKVEALKMKPGKWRSPE